MNTGSDGGIFTVDHHARFKTETNSRNAWYLSEITNVDDFTFTMKVGESESGLVNTTSWQKCTSTCIEEMQTLPGTSVEIK